MSDTPPTPLSLVPDALDSDDAQAEPFADTADAATQATLEAELEELTSGLVRAPQHVVPRQPSMLDLIQQAQLPPSGAQVQLIGCPHCSQPMILAMGQTPQGQFIVFPYCFNSLCAGKRGGIALPGGSMPPLRGLR